MTKWEERCQVLLIVVAIADEDPLAIADLAILAGIIGVGGVVLQTDGEGGRQFARRSLVTEKDIGEGIALFLAVIPHLQDGRNFVDPRHFDGGADIQHDDRVLVGFGHALDQLVLPAGQLHIDAVGAFGFPFAVQARDQYHHVRIPGQLYSFGDGVLRLRGLVTEHHGAPARAAFPVIFHFDGVGFATFEPDLFVKGLSHIGIVRVIDQEIVIEIELAPTHAAQGKRVNA